MGNAETVIPVVVNLHESHDESSDLFVAEVGDRVGVKPWQVQQAADDVFTRIQQGDINTTAQD